MWQTHEVFNQVPAQDGRNLFELDVALQEAVAREGASWHTDELRAQGATLGSSDTERLAEIANRHVPALVPFDRTGHHIDRVDFHPAWHELLAMLYAHGVHASAWLEPRPGAHVARAASFYLHGQAEAGALCPVTMTFASIPVLRRDASLFGILRDKFHSRIYDARDRPLPEKHSAMIGMGMTEKQGGSDLRGITTQARAIGTGSREFLLVGHKWFFSAPTSDAHLVLARSGDALSCYFVPRWLPDGTRNSIRIQRLKDKLGNRSNASAEVEFQDAFGILVGEAGRGIPTIMEMAAQTRLDCVLGSAALMRRALVEAVHHARHRGAFGRLLVEQPLMRNVLADLALESEAATTLAMRLAKAVESDHDPLERAYRRIVTPAAKFWVCKRAVQLTAECMEVWGGNGYVEDGPMARLFREAPVNSIWEGSGNVMCLDVLRAAAREPDALQTLHQELAQACAGDPVLCQGVKDIERLLRSPADSEWEARHLASQMVLLVQAALLRRNAPSWVADAFIASRLHTRTGQVAGLLKQPDAAGMLLERALPQ